MTRKIDIGTTEYTEVIAVDTPEFNANHEYVVRHFEKDENGASNSVFVNIKFQKGPVKEHGVNGCHNEDLIAIVIDRLQGFQKGDFACRENAIALTKLEEALMWLRKRTNDRKARGVEGTSIK